MIYLPYLVHFLSTHFLCTTSRGIFSGSLQSLFVCVFIPFLPFLLVPIQQITQEDKVQPIWSRQCHPSLCLEGKVDLQFTYPLPSSACTSDCFIYLHNKCGFQLSCQMHWVSRPLPILLSRVHVALSSITQTHLMCMYPMFRFLNVG